MLGQISRIISVLAFTGGDIIIAGSDTQWCPLHIDP
jgi:hypothetical protein